MQGFQPAARRLAQLPQHLADGGVVGFGARGLSGLRDLVPKMQAMGYQQAAPAPAAAPEARGTSALRAMIPQVEAMGYRQASAGQPQYFADGGLIRGPGTGTSDSIEDEVEPGTFIMPADSTQAIGPSALEQMGTVPVRLSDGEFKVPPEQVTAIGEAVLKLMKDTTHTPVNGVDGGQTDEEVAQAQGFSPSAAQRMQELPQFADGGLVPLGAAPEDQPIQRNLAIARAEAMAPEMEEMQLAQIQAVEDARETPVGFADGGMVDPARRANSFGDAAAVTRDPGVTQVRTSTSDTFGRPPAPAPAAPVASAPTAATRLGTLSDPRSTAFDPNPFAAANAAKLSTAGQSSRAIVEAGMPPAPAPATARNSLGDAAAATRDGSVSQVASGFQPGASGVPAPQAVAAAPQPAALPSAAQRMAAAPAPAAPMGWAERNAQRNMEVTASSIVNSPERTAARQRLGMLPQAAGFQPQRFADGGTVEDRAVFGFYPQLADNGRTTRATADQLRQGVQAAGPTSFQPAAPLTAPPPAPAQRLDNLSDPRSTQFAGAPAPAAAPAGPLDRATRALSSAAGPAPLTGGPISAQNMGAADALARRSAADALAQMPNAPQQGVQTPTVLHSDNSWLARNNLRNLEVSASSITNNGGRFDRHKGASPASLAYRAALETDNALRGSAPALAQQAMKEQGDLQRTSMLNQGALDRTSMQEQGLNLRAVIEARRSGNAPAGYRWNGAGGLEAIPGGPADPNVRGSKAPLNDVQSKALQFGTRMQTSGAALDKLAAQGVNQPGLIKRGADAIGLGAAANWTQSGEQQQVEQSQRDFINAVLRRESGAAIADSEFSNARQQYFPQPGDSPEVIAQKRMNREIATAGVLAEVPDSEKRVNQVLTQANANAPAPAAAPGQPQRVESQQAFAALPSGSRFVAPDGTVRVKP